MTAWEPAAKPEGLGRDLRRNAGEYISRGGGAEAPSGKHDFCDGAAVQGELAHGNRGPLDSIVLGAPPPQLGTSRVVSHAGRVGEHAYLPAARTPTSFDYPEHRAGGLGCTRRGGRLRGVDRRSAVPESTRPFCHHAHQLGDDSEFIDLVRVDPDRSKILVAGHKLDGRVGP